jgi:phage gp29-like protein
MDREWWARFLDRYGAPFVVGKYDGGDDASRSTLERAFMYAQKLGGLVVSRETEVEIKQAAASDAGDAFEKFHSLCNREVSNLVVGQTLSSDAQPTGLGSGTANLQSEVRQDIRQFDALLLGRTFATQLAAQFLQINGLKGKPPLFLWGSLSPVELKAWADLLQSLKNAGLRVGDEGIEALSERFGMPLERDDSAGAPPAFPFSVRPHAAAPIQEDAIARAAAASLARSLGKHHAQIRQIILDAPSPQVAMARVEAYAAKMDPSHAAKIVEEALLAYAANGSVVHAR